MDQPTRPNTNTRKRYAAVVTPTNYKSITAGAGEKTAINLPGLLSRMTLKQTNTPQVR